MVELILPMNAEACYRHFIDSEQMKLWLPNLKTLKVVRTDEDNRPLEITFTTGETLTYALVYHYADDSKRVRWVPSAGLQDGVSGHAEFEPHEDGCRFRYTAVARRGREPHHAENVAHAFAAWIKARAGRPSRPPA